MFRSRFHTFILRRVATKPSRSCISDSASRSSSTATIPVTDALPARWLSDLKRRVGHCLFFGLNEEQTMEAGAISKSIAQDWKELAAGSEGFLTGMGRAGFEGREVVWGEMDVMGHVNNVTYIRYAESARINWAQNFANHIDPKHKKEWSSLWTPKDVGLILRSMKTDYKFPMTWPDRISVYHKLRSAPTSSTDSITLDVLILSERHQRPAARCVEDIVVYDYQRGQKTPLRPFMVEKFQETVALQEKAKARNEGRVRGLLERVGRLERESWDREGAVEDKGN